MLAQRDATVFLLRQVELEQRLHLLHLLPGAGRLEQHPPMPRRECGHHHPPSVAGFEILTIGAVDMVARAWSVVAVDLNFPDVAEMTERREGRVGQRVDDHSHYGQDKNRKIPERVADQTAVDASR